MSSANSMKTVTFSPDQIDHLIEHLEGIDSEDRGSTRLRILCDELEEQRIDTSGAESAVELAVEDWDEILGRLDSDDPGHGEIIDAIREVDAYTTLHLFGDDLRKLRAALAFADGAGCEGARELLDALPEEATGDQI